jgi:hypothetical protein
MVHLISLRFDFSLVLLAASLAPFPLHNTGEDLAMLSIHCINRSLTSSARLKGVASKVKTCLVLTWAHPQDAVRLFYPLAIHVFLHC